MGSPSRAFSESLVGGDETLGDPPSKTAAPIRHRPALIEVGIEVEWVAREDGGAAAAAAAGVAEARSEQQRQVVAGHLLGPQWKDMRAGAVDTRRVVHPDGDADHRRGTRRVPEPDEVAELQRRSAMQRGGRAQTTESATEGETHTRSTHVCVSL